MRIRREGWQTRRGAPHAWPEPARYRSSLRRRPLGSNRRQRARSVTPRWRSIRRGHRRPLEFVQRHRRQNVLPPRRRANPQRYASVPIVAPSMRMFLQNVYASAADVVARVVGCHCRYRRRLASSCPSAVVSDPRPASPRERAPLPVTMRSSRGIDARQPGRVFMKTRPSIVPRDGTRIAGCETPFRGPPRQNAARYRDRAGRTRDGSREGPSLAIARRRRCWSATTSPRRDRPRRAKNADYRQRGVERTVATKPGSSSRRS